MDQTSQVVVVGAGIVGCAIAYELARRGVRVRVIDRGEVGRGATQASAGVLAPYIEAHDRRPLLDLTTRSLDLYDEFVARIVEDSGVAVQYMRTGTLEIATRPSDMSRLEGIHAACIERGIPAELFDAETVRRVEPQLAPTVRGGVIVASHGFIGASELTAALRRAAAAHGASFQTASAVTRIERNGAGIRVETTGDAFACESAVMATGSWSGHLEIDGASPVPIRPVRGQLLHLGWPAPPLQRVLWSPDCYLVPWSDGSVLAGATIEEVGFDERATVAGIRSLIDATQRVTPKASKASFKAARVGLRPATPDELPVIGPSAAVPGLVYACGHFRNGILLAPLTAAMVADLVVDRRLDAALDITNPSRFGAC